MERRAFSTPLGEVWLWGERGAFEGSRPVVLAIAGALDAERPPLFGIQSQVSEADCLFAHIPGHHCPPLVVPRAGVYSAAFGLVLDQLKRPTVLFGVSAGGLIALGVRSPRLAGMLLADPPLGPHPLLSERYHAYPDLLALFAWDCHHLIGQVSVPTVVLAGDPNAPKKPYPWLPTLLSTADRLLLKSNKNVRLVEVENASHHVLASDNSRPLLYLRQLLELTRTHSS